MTGRIISCDENGVASVEYKNYIYEDVKILDTDLLEWLKEIDKSLDNIGICFATDKNGDISELGLLSADFFIMAKDSSRYFAIRGDQMMSFTSDTPLEIDHCYSGYFCYPNYCSKKTYDSVNVGDLLNGYKMYSNEDTAYIWKEEISLLN